MTGRAHVAALIDALKALPSMNVYDGQVPGNAPMPYVVVFSSVGRGTADRLEGTKERIDLDVHITCVGANRASAAIAGERARDVILNTKLAVQGRRTWRGQHLDSQAIRRDEDIADRIVLYGVDTYRLSSVPG